MLSVCSGCVHVSAQWLSCSIVLDSLGTHGLQSARLCCPWNFRGKNIGGRLAISFSRGNFLTQGSNLHLLHWQEDSLPLCHLGSPVHLKRNVLYGFTSIFKKLDFTTEVIRSWTFA